MILLDCGNSLLKWQYLDQERLLASGGLRYDDNWTEVLASRLEGLPDKSVYLTSVLDERRQQKLEQVLTRLHCESHRFRSAATQLGVSSAYAEPGTLGDDRWVALLAAHQLAPQGCLVIDAGSAITLDLLRGDGQHLGGAIIPGTRTSQQHFREIFSYLDLADLQADAARPPGCSTPAAIHIDYERESLDILRDLLQQWSARLDDNAQVLLAGGDADRVEEYLPQAVTRVPDLVFLGMRRLIQSEG